MQTKAVSETLPNAAEVNLRAWQVQAVAVKMLATGTSFMMELWVSGHDSARVPNDQHGQITDDEERKKKKGKKNEKTEKRKKRKKKRNTREKK